MNRNYTNKEAAQITGLTPRQVLSWSEKGLVRAINDDDIKSHTRRLYDVYALLELGLAAKLFNMGFGYRAVSNILNKTRGQLTTPALNGILRIDLGASCLLQISLAEIGDFINGRLP